MTRIGRFANLLLRYDNGTWVPLNKVVNLRENGTVVFTANVNNDSTELEGEIYNYTGRFAVPSNMDHIDYYMPYVCVYTILALGTCFFVYLTFLWISGCWPPASGDSDLELNDSRYPSYFKPNPGPEEPTGASFSGGLPAVPYVTCENVGLEARKRITLSMSNNHLVVETEERIAISPEEWEGRGICVIANPNLDGGPDEGLLAASAEASEEHRSVIEVHDVPNEDSKPDATVEKENFAAPATVDGIACRKGRQTSMGGFSQSDSGGSGRNDSAFPYEYGNQMEYRADGKFPRRASTN